MPIKKPIAESPELLPLAPQGVRHGVLSPNGMVQVHYEAPGGKLFVGDSIAWLRSLGLGSVDMVFADPPYNIKKAEWDDFGSMNAYVAWSREWGRSPVGREIEIAGRGIGWHWRRHDSDHQTRKSGAHCGA